MKHIQRSLYKLKRPKELIISGKVSEKKLRDDICKGKYSILHEIIRLDNVRKECTYKENGKTYSVIRIKKKFKNKERREFKALKKYVRKAAKK